MLLERASICNQPQSNSSRDRANSRLALNKSKQMRRGASSFSNRRWNNEQRLSSLYTSKSLDLGYHTSQFIQFREFHQDYRIDCPCHCFSCLDAGDSERSFCNVPQCVGFGVDKDISLQTASLDLLNNACFRIKSLTRYGSKP